MKTMKGRDLQQDSVAASTAKHQNTQSEITDTTYTARDAKVTRYIKYHVKTLNTKRLHIKCCNASQMTKKCYGQSHKVI